MNMKLWGKEYTKREIMQNIGDVTQAFGLRSSTINDGAGRGMRIIDLKTGGGLTATIVPDRGLDIYNLSFNNIPISFVSKVGYIAPSLYEHPGAGFLRSFTAGMLTTCGYRNMGNSCTDDGEVLDTHGRASATPAEFLSQKGEWIGDDYIMEISGAMREAVVFGEYIRMTRKITAKAGENKIIVEDTLENAGYNTQPMQLLYHCNFGYPMVAAGSKLVSGKTLDIKPRDPAAASGFDTCREFCDPIHDYAEQCFYYTFEPDADKMAWAGIYNPNLDMTAYVKFDMTTLPHMIEWKQMGEGDYVCGLEPATWYPEGRAAARERGCLDFIEPGEIKHFKLELGIEAGNKEIK
ncbi:MAG: aldose 1-epimerase family protein [Clostridia bacterium]|nr:aldose 1-epimerase family protein [Clostridia bacterium]